MIGNQKVVPQARVISESLVFDVRSQLLDYGNIWYIFKPMINGDDRSSCVFVAWYQPALQTHGVIIYSTWLLKAGM